jgi:2-polyprenyl-3-methyl-5-hydroxy-6-metoxy-1,4-benzoquinol methylase
LDQRRLVHPFDWGSGRGKFLYQDGTMIYSIKTADGGVSIEEMENGKRRLVIQKIVPGGAQDGQTWITAYSLPLIKHILQIKGLDFLLDEIRRDEDQTYVQDSMVLEIFSYIHPSDLAGKRILDFGCGSGASTVVLGRLLPGVQIVGIELVPEYLEIARERVGFYNLPDVTFMTSPDAMSLPETIGQFDAIIFSAVFEHLLPQERSLLLPKIWEHLKPGGLLFVRETPFRYAPVESHTTGLPLLNYLPDRAAFRFARRFSPAARRCDTWEAMLRIGIRGATEGEILGILKKSQAAPELIEPSLNGIHSRVELWANLPTRSRFMAIKSIMKIIFSIVWRITGRSLVPQLSLAIKKLP